MTEPTNDAIRFMENFQGKMRSSRAVTITALVCAAVTCLCSLGACLWNSRQCARQIYVLDQGTVLSAVREQNGVQKDLEVMGHVSRFHELFFNMAPSMESINQNIDRALNLADGSAYDYYCDLREQQYFSRLIQTNSTQQVVVDSVRCDVACYPYRAETFASIYVLRESNISRYSFHSSCFLTEVTRTPGNPHGLMISRFNVDRFDLMDTRKRK